MKNKIPSITIGLDLGDKKHAICVLNKVGEVIDERSITNHRESLRRLSLKYPKSRIAMEVGQHSPWTSRFFEALGHEVLVANPRKLCAIYTSTRKSDQSDAYMIARLARVDPTLLHPIQHGRQPATTFQSHLDSTTSSGCLHMNVRWQSGSDTRAVSDLIGQGRRGIGVAANNRRGRPLALTAGTAILPFAFSCALFSRINRRRRPLVLTAGTAILPRSRLAG